MYSLLKRLHEWLESLPVFENTAKAIHRAPQSPPQDLLLLVFKGSVFSDSMTPDRQEQFTIDIHCRSKDLAGLSAFKMSDALMQAIDNQRENFVCEDGTAISLDRSGSSNASTEDEDVIVFSTTISIEE